MTIIPKDNPMIRTFATSCGSYDPNVIESVMLRLGAQVAGQYWIGPFHYRVINTTINFWGTEQYPKATMTMTVEYWSRVETPK